MPRSASAGASPRKATYFKAPRALPTARAPAAAVISESIRIPPRLSLSLVASPALEWSCEQQETRSAGNGTTCERNAERRPLGRPRPDLYRQMDPKDSVLAERETLSSWGASASDRKCVAANADPNASRPRSERFDRQANDEGEAHRGGVFVKQIRKDHHRTTAGHVPVGQTTREKCHC